MNLITEKQKTFLKEREIKIGDTYMFPIIGFFIYEKPDLSCGDYLDINPLTKSLADQSFTLKHICSDGIFVRGNFTNKPHRNDFYLEIDDIKYRSLIEMSLLFLICFLPMILHTLFTKNRKNINSNQTI